MTIMGANIENDGYVAIDLLDSNEKISCKTNLDLCCNNKTIMSGHGPVGNWYFPNGSIVMHESDIGDAPPYFTRNRGKSILRLFIKGNDTAMRSPPQRGRFHCEVPNSSNITQTYYINICMLLPIKHHTIMISNLVCCIHVFSIVDIGEVVLSQPAGFNATRIAGEINFTLECSAYIMSPLPVNVPVPKFEWFSGPDNSSLPSQSGVTISNVTSSHSTYTSALQFSTLSESHSGLYTCRLGGNERLAANTNITVKGTSESSQ